MGDRFTMEYIYAALLLHRLKKEISEASVTKVVKAAGASPDEVKIKALVSALGEVNIDEALKAATVAPAVQAPATAAPVEAPKEKAEAKKEEEKKEEEALAGLSSLFG